MKKYMFYLIKLSNYSHFLIYSKFSLSLNVKKTYDYADINEPF